MLHRHDLGFRDQGRDLAAPDYYASVFRAAGRARALPPTVFRSLTYAALEDAAVWSQAWVCAGSHADVPNVGDLLPYTVGTYGLHVQRTASGLVARFNKAQHGGCRVVPVQCQQGSKTRCSFTSCGHSRDRAAIPASALGNGTPEMHQYLGLRPERLFMAHACSWGPLIFVSLADNPMPLEKQLASLGPPSRAFRTRVQRKKEYWLEFAANWKLMLEALIDGVLLEGGDERDWVSTRATLRCADTAIVYALFPNAVMLTTADETCVVILQPTALGRTLCRVSVWSEEDRPPLVDWQSEIVARSIEAEIRHTGQVRQGTDQGTDNAPEEAAGDTPIQHEGHAIWWQRALAHRVLSRPQPVADLPLYDNRRVSSR